jgi:RNA-directed DNA polymerase
MTTDATAPLERGHTLPWTRVQRHVVTRQQRIYRAASRGDGPTVRKRQRLMRHAWSATRLAVRRVTQDTRGNKTAGMDGVNSLTATQRLRCAPTFTRAGTASPVRRAWRPTPGSPDPRPLGIPTMADRARQTVATYVREPAGEARVAPNRDGVRPGRSCHEAITALHTAMGHTATYVLDAAIETCCERINPTA